MTLIVATEAPPYVHIADADVVVVAKGSVQHKRFASPVVANAVAARVPTDLRNWPEQANRILRVSEIYADAALRFARLRARKEGTHG